jgi:type II secretory pathway pseudopilin PulG
MIELLVVLAILALAAFIGIPALQTTIARAAFEGAAQEMANALRQARLESIRNSAPAVVTFDTSTNELVAFIDLNNASAATGYRGSDLLYNPEAAPILPDNAKDFVVYRMRISKKARGGGPAASPETINGLTDRAVPPRAVVFTAEGAVRDVGGFRLNDGRRDAADKVRNFLEVRVEPASTGRIQLRKWHEADGKWYARDMRDGKSTWEWY